jgi:membrane fusion protein, heavy metal efflux system
MSRKTTGNTDAFQADSLDAETPPASVVAQQSIDRRAWSRKRQLGAAAIGATLGLLAIGIGTWSEHSRGNQARGTAVAPSPGLFRPTGQQLNSLTIQPVGLHGFVSEELTEGKIGVNRDRATPVFSPFSGRVIRVIAGLGDSVKAGSALATVEATEFVQAQNDLSTGAAQVKLARISEARKHAVYDAKGGSLQDWQQAQADLTAAENALNLARSRLKILGKSDAQINDLESSHSTSVVATITAPIRGIVADRQIGPGQYLQAGGDIPVFTIDDPTSVWLLANVREADAGLVRLAQVMEVHVLAYPNRAFKARITYVAALIDPITHRLAVRAEIDNRDAALKPEMFANFRILTSDVSESPAVPEAAVVYEGDVAHVWVAGAGGVLAYRLIKPGRTNDGLVEVLDGLKPGERVVTKGSLFIDQAADPDS